MFCTSNIAGFASLRIFCFDDEKRGKIEFTGNILFTHFREIGEPNKALDSLDMSYVPPNVSGQVSINRDVSSKF